MRDRSLQTLVLAFLVVALCPSTTGNCEEIAIPDGSIRPRARPANLLSPSYRSQAPGESFTDKEVGANCYIYINQDGTYGTHGLMLRRELLGQGRSADKTEYFFERRLPGMASLCPKFYELNQEQKINFWIWYFMSLSHDESKCNDPAWRVNLDAPNGVAAGEFQLDEAWSGRSFRGQGCDVEGRVDGLLMLNPVNNISCAVQQLGDSLCGFYTTGSGCTENAQAPYGEHLTWARLRSGTGPVINRVKEFELCK